MYPAEGSVGSVQKKSRRFLLWIGLAIVVLLVAVAAAAYAILGNTKKEAALTPTSSAPAKITVATNDEVKQNLTALDTTIKQAATDQAAAKTALKDGTNQIKVGS